MNSPIKWMGSKKKLIPWIQPKIPLHNTFIEPFMGSGAVFFSQEPKNALCSDIQAEPIVIINAIKNNPKYFYEEFVELSEYLWFKGSEYYYSLRETYNKGVFKDDNERAVMFMVLLRAGFNGLVRFNPKGEWNVPFGDRGWTGSKKQAVRLYNSFGLDKIEEWSEFLNQGNKQFIQQSFEETINTASKDDLIYADPPYLITTQKYNAWNIEHETKLAEALKNASKRGAKFILSNVYRYKGEENTQLLELYSDFEYELKSHSYIVGPNRHKKVEEIIIFN